VSIGRPSPPLLGSIIAVIGCSIFLASSFNNNNNNNNSYNLSRSFAEASQIPLDVKETFSSIQKTDDGKANPSSIKIDSEFVDPDEHCEFCYRIEYTPGAIGKGGALFKTDKAVDLTESNRISFFAKGGVGGEQIQVSAAGKNLDNAKAVKFGITSKDVVLGNSWKKYEMDLSNVDLKAITHGFALKVNKNIIHSENDGISTGEGSSNSNSSNSPIVIYLKGITYEEFDAVDPIAISTSPLTENQ
jgi:hypothetical protein